MTRALMFQGTGSDVGKSLIVAGLARAYTRRGLKVRPFKPQNMSNNAAVTPDGGEIGRAQALQAQACRVQPTVDMNPVLLKPQTDTGAQVIVRGKMVGTRNAADFQTSKGELLTAVLESFATLSDNADLILVEGAGSASEINLRQGDIANMGFARAADIPVVLIGDIDRGGVIASIVGTANVVEENDRKQIGGFLINRFRGDLKLFADGIEAIESRTGWPNFGIVPHFPRAHLLPAEDAASLGQKRHQTMPGSKIKIAVPLFSRIANFDDFDPLEAEPDVELHMVPAGEPIPKDADLIILPGTKSTIGDLAFLKEQGWDIDVMAHVRHGGQVLGICGGYQMLGQAISDPDGIEGPTSHVKGMGLLAIETVLTDQKKLVKVQGKDTVHAKTVHGYEMHVGETVGQATKRPMLDLNGRADGAVSTDGKIMGCYLHGLFSNDDFRHAFLQSIVNSDLDLISQVGLVDQVLDELAEHLDEHIDLDRLLSLAKPV